MASIDTKPEKLYYGTYQNFNAPVKLRIATGGAGQSGLLKVLADAFIVDQVDRTLCDPFAVAWLKSDTTASFNLLAEASADLSITYSPPAEEVAIVQGIAERRVYAWRDHFMLVGPKSNPANLSTAPGETIQSLFSQLYRAAIASNNSIRFLSRFDKSATNIKESTFWISIGQIPWSYPFSPFYHIYPAFPYQALETAAKLGEYTLVDRGTWYGVDQRIRDDMMVFLEGKDDDKDGEMLNPAHALVGSSGRHKDMANTFADWISSAEGGQKVIDSFAINDVVLYTRAP